MLARELRKTRCASWASDYPATVFPYIFDWRFLVVDDALHQRKHLSVLGVLETLKPLQRFSSTR